MEDCLYFSISGALLGWTHLFPHLAFLGLWLLSINKDGSKQWYFFTFAWYLTLWQIVIWALQSCFAIVRPHAQCAQLHTYAFPSQESFFFGAIVTAFFAYCFFKGIEPGWFTYLTGFFFLIVPQTALVYYAYNRWHETVISLVLGFVASVFFVSIVEIYIRRLMPHILNQAPWTWFHLSDSYLLVTQKECAQVYSTRRQVRKCQRAIDARARLYRRRGWF